MKLTDCQRQGVLLLLSYLSERDTLSLARTITNNLISFGSVKDAQEAIILHEVDLRSFLSRKKVTKEILFKYLHNNNIEIAANSDKNHLATKLLQIWEQQLSGLPSANCIAPKPVQDNIFKGDVDMLAERFAVWFYSILNDYITSPHSGKLCVEHFWNDCSLRLVMQSSLNSEVKEIQKDSESVVNVLKELQLQHKLFFNPNVSNGVHGKIEAHGLVLVMACGTLHQVNNCVGVFQQVFGLIRDPFMQNNWRIKSTTIILKSGEISKQPELDQESLQNLFLPHL